MEAAWSSSRAARLLYSTILSLNGRHQLELLWKSSWRNDPGFPVSSNKKLQSQKRLLCLMAFTVNSPFPNGKRNLTAQAANTMRSQCMAADPHCTSTGWILHGYLLTVRCAMTNETPDCGMNGRRRYTKLSAALFPRE
ncbi:hypothetical protein BaRGS_00031603 [Batillaria attramentaria]|uniref:Uncharacterized protein n=1 Tax=Batillaria attramentaria TaxID=370345 RepID=A0ABD0JQH7_9CAEN